MIRVRQIRAAFLWFSVAMASGTAARAGDWSSLRAADARVAAVAYRLAVGASPYCPDAYPVTGMLLHHLAEYDEKGRRIEIERHGLDRGPGVLTVLADGPAARAGLQAGDVLLSVNGRPFPDARMMAAEEDRELWRAAVNTTEAQLEAALRLGPARLRVLRKGRELDATLSSIPGCPLRVRLAYDRQLNAFARDGYVIVTTRMLEFVRSDDELAIVIAHELAHNMLGHEQRLAAQKVPTGIFRSFGKNAARVKATEMEADRLGLKLSWAAGYDIGTAPLFWKRFYDAVPGGLQIFRTHPGLKARQRVVSEVIAEVGAEAARP